MGRLSVIRNEIDTDPLTRGYSTMSDAEVASDMSDVPYRDAEGSIHEMLTYLGTVDNRTNEGGDTDATLLLGRLKLVAESEPDTDPFRRAGVWAAGGSGVNLQIELNATGNTVTFGSAHDISTLSAKDAIELLGTTADDGVQHITSVASQVITLTSITVTETLERVMRVFKIQDAKLVTREEVQNARGIFSLFTSTQGDINFANTEIGLAFRDMETAGVWKSADTTALENFSKGVQTRGVELGVGTVREGDVTAARAL